jgi:hypothetical protein
MFAINKIEKYETELLGCKYVFVDNKSNITNVIFTGCGQRYYMMISWFNSNLDYNYLYLNTMHCDYTNVDIYKLIISTCNSDHYNMIGISYGAYAAIVYASMFPTKSVIIVDPSRMGWGVNIESCIKNLEVLETKLYYHRSLHPHDIQEYMQMRNALEKSSMFYTIKCSLSETHSANIPNEEMILQYINHSFLLSKNCKIIMTETKMSDLSLEFLPLT